MNAYLKIFFLITFLQTSQMKKPEQHKAPKTIIKGSGFINTDFDFLKAKGRPEILLLNPNSTVIGFKKIPYLIYATPKLNYVSFPLNIKKDINCVKMLILQSTSSNEFKSRKYFKKIPDWICHFKGIEYLRLDEFNLSQIEELKSLPIRHLILINVKYNDDSTLIESLKKLKNLKYLAYDSSIAPQTIGLINQKIKSISTIREAEYYKEKLDETF